MKLIHNNRINSINTSKHHKIKKRHGKSIIAISIILTFLFFGIIPVIDWGEIKERAEQIQYDPTMALDYQTPSQPEGFTFTNGTLLSPLGDLNSIDGNYSMIKGDGYAGYYIATYSFENDTDGTIPVGWTDEDTGAGATTGVLSSYANHNKVLHFDDTNIQTAAAATQFTNKTFGTAELWFRSTGSSGYTSVRLLDDPIGYGPYIYMSSGYWVASDNGTGVNTTVASADTWYHIRIDFECAGGLYENLSADTYNVYINDVKYGPYGFHTGDKAGIDEFMITTSSSFFTGDVYVDAVGFSWDPNYDIGKNKDLFAGLDFQVDLSVNDADLYQVECLQYSHRTNISATVDLDIWNWTSSQWNEVESVDNPTTFDKDLVVLGNSSNYLNLANNSVRIRYQSLCGSETQIELDALKLLYSTTLPNNTYETPIQPDNFTITKGTLTTYGELGTIDGNYSVIEAGEVGGGFEWSSTMSPNSDYETQWDDGGGTPHYLHVDEDPDSVDANYITEYTGSNLYEKYGFEDIEIGNGTVTQVKIRVSFLKAGSGAPQINLYFDGAYQGWKSLSSGVHDYTWTGLSGNETDVTNMQVRFKSSCIGFPVKFNLIHALEASVYYEEASDYQIDFQIDVQVDNASIFYPYSLTYSYKTNVSKTIDFDIWNWLTNSWYEIESVNNYTTFNDKTFWLEYGSAYVNSTNCIRIRLQSTVDQNDFELQIDKFRLNYYTI